MTCTFVDGPAEGVNLSLRTAPHFLRVVQHAITGTIDALDQPEDVPAAGETIHVYVAEAGSWSWVHVRARGGAGGRWESARYWHLPVELVGMGDGPTVTPTELFADREKWGAWITAHGNALAVLHGHDPWPGAAMETAPEPRREPEEPSA